jgi:hypothetical protein
MELSKMEMSEGSMNSEQLVESMEIKVIGKDVAERYRSGLWILKAIMKALLGTGLTVKLKPRLNREILYDFLSNVVKIVIR